MRSSSPTLRLVRLAAHAALGAAVGQRRAARTSTSSTCASAAHSPSDTLGGVAEAALRRAHVQRVLDAVAAVHPHRAGVHRTGKFTVRLRRGVRQDDALVVHRCVRTAAAVQLAGADRGRARRSLLPRRTEPALVSAHAVSPAGRCVLSRLPGLAPTRCTYLTGVVGAPWQRPRCEDRAMRELPAAVRELLEEARTSCTVATLMPTAPGTASRRGGVDGRARRRRQRSRPAGKARTSPATGAWSCAARSTAHP